MNKKYLIQSLAGLFTFVTVVLIGIMLAKMFVVNDELTLQNIQNMQFVTLLLGISCVTTGSASACVLVSYCFKE